MNVQRTSSIAKIVAFSIFGLAAATQCLAADDKNESINDAWIKAVTANDLDGVMKLYADDAVAWFPDEPEHSGAAAIRASYKNLFDTYTVTAATLTNRHHEGDAKHESHWGNFSLSLKAKADGKTTTMTGRYTDVTELRKGHWVYLADHASGDPPPPAAK
jgi:ketosteroid isomerase-like protein